MRVPLDECLPRKLKFELVGHEAKTVPEMGRASKKNSALHRCSVKLFNLIEGKGSCEGATSSVLIELMRHFEKEETPWPDASLSESVPS